MFYFFREVLHGQEFDDVNRKVFMDFCRVVKAYWDQFGLIVNLQGHF